MLGRDVIEAEVFFRGAVAGLPQEDLRSIQNFIKFVREQRRRRQADR